MSRIIRSQEQRQKRKKKFIIISALFSVLFLVFLYFAIRFVSLPSLQITKVVVTGNEILEEEDLRSSANKFLSGKYLYVIPRTNIFFYPRETIQNYIAHKFPRIRAISLSVSGSRELFITISERKPVALWCGKTIPETPEGKDCYYLDTSAFIFDKAPIFSGDAYFEFYGNGKISDDTIIGKNFLDNDIFQNIMSLRDFFVEYNQKIVNVLLFDDGSVEFFARAGCKIRFNIDQDIASIESNIDAIFNLYDWDESGIISQNENICEKLEYVDFRFGNKIYYREKGKTPVKKEDSQILIPEIMDVQPQTATSAEPLIATSTQPIGFVGGNNA